ncbi:MAG: hypothetical protein GXO77_03835 [Calditrichaeota bacterium]|nr:hypothetical protein [Calditrichota bacterium]
MRLAMPLWQNRVAPVFDTCSKIKLYDIEKGKIIGIETINLRNMSVGQRLRAIYGQNVEVLVCNGVSLFYRACLQTHYIRVFPNIYGKEEQVLKSIILKPGKN